MKHKNINGSVASNLSHSLNPLHPNNPFKDSAGGLVLRRKYGQSLVVVVNTPCVFQIISTKGQGSHEIKLRFVGGERTDYEIHREEIFFAPELTNKHGNIGEIEDEGVA